MATRPKIPSSPAFDEITRGAQFRDLISVRVTATPEAIFRALAEVALPDMKLAWLLGEMRYLPARLTGHAPPPGVHRPFLDVLRDGGTVVLHDDTPREIITGSAGQLHRVSNQAPVHFENRAAFDGFTDPQHEKLFMSIRVAPAPTAGEHYLALEHATLALSPEAERKFRRYWRVIKPMGAFMTHELLKAVRTKAQAAARRAGPTPGGDT